VVHVITFICISIVIIYREHTVADGLSEVALWNSAQLVSQDLQEAFSALQQKRSPQYSKL